MPLTLNTKTYNGTGIQNGIGGYMERSGGIAASFSPVTSSVKLEKDRTRITTKLVLPIVQSEATACACPGEVLQADDVIVNARLAPGATDAQRLDLYNRFKDLVNTTAFRDQFTLLTVMPGT